MDSHVEIFCIWGGLNITFRTVSFFSDSSGCDESGTVHGAEGLFCSFPGLASVIWGVFSQVNVADRNKINKHDKIPYSTWQTICSTHYMFIVRAGPRDLGALSEILPPSGQSILMVPLLTADRKNGTFLKYIFCYSTHFVMGGEKCLQF